jgi:ribosomal-protein-alanine N-acetyltransferase
MIELARQSSAAARWSRQQFETLFATADSGPRECLILVIEAPHEPATHSSPLPSQGLLGFLAAQRVDGEWDLENLVVAEESRRQGLGTMLVREFIDQAWRGNAHAIFLEVRESNEAARKLYHKLGFTETGKRKHYYANPLEHAVLYRFSRD